MKQPTAAGGNRLTRAGAQPENGAEFVIASIEPLGGRERLEALHPSDPTFDALVVLLDSLRPLQHRS
jgi:hypothetical protein